MIIRVPFFLLFGFNRGPKKKKGKRVLLGNLVGKGFWKVWAHLGYHVPLALKLESVKFGI